MGSRKWRDIMQQLLHKENKCLQDLFSLSEKDSAIPPSDDRGLEYHKWPGGNEQGATDHCFFLQQDWRPLSETKKGSVQNK